MEHPTSPLTARRLLAVVGLPLLVVVATVAYLIVIGDRLPDQVATHWGADRQADGFTSRSQLPWLVGGLTLALAAPMMALALVPQTSLVIPRALNGIPLGMTTFLVLLFAQTTVGQLDGGSASPLALRVIPIAAVIGLLAGALAALVAGEAPIPPSTTAPAPPGAERIPLGNSQTAVWAGRTPTGKPTLVLLAVAALINVVCAVVLGAWWLVVFLAFISIIVIAGTNFSVTAGPTGVRVVGILGVPRIYVPLEQITAASAGTVKAAHYGGWGLRVRPKGDSAVLTRSGPALVVHRTDGARLNISLDNPEQPAAVISTLLDLRASGPAAASSQA